MGEFKTYHPIVNFTYFVFVIGFSGFFMHPVCLLISLVSGFIYSVMLKGAKQVKTNLIYILPMMIFMALINPLFNHAGVNVILYLPSGNPVTLEACVYGVCAALMIASVILHFSCYNEIMTSDKFIYLFGKIIPGLSVIISMTLRFVPKFISQFKAVISARKCMGRDVTNGGILKRLKSGLSVLSSVTTWAFENAIETADSMKARGYGILKRTSFSIFKFDKRDKKALIFILILGMYTLFGKLMGEMNFTYFPSMQGQEASVFGVSVFLAQLLLFMFPVMIEAWEVKKWKLLKSKI